MDLAARKQLPLLTVTLLVGLAGGFLIRAVYPRHHYIRAQGVLMYDETTGHLCSGLKKPNLKVAGDLFDKLAAEEEQKHNDILAAAFSENPTTLPYCGEE